MKKTVIIALSVILCLVLFCSCADNTSSPTAPETVVITYAELYEANTYSSLTAKHTSIHLTDNGLYGDEYMEHQYYWSRSGLAFTTSTYTDGEGNAQRDLRYVSDDGPCLYFRPMTAGNATFDIFEYYVNNSASCVEDLAIFGLVPPDYNQTITECKKTANGYEITGENSDMSFLPTFYNAFFTDGECAEGDKIVFKMELNDKYETLKYANYYVFADGRETIKANYGEFVYDGSDTPDFVKNVNDVLENDLKGIKVNIITENGAIERKVYSAIFLLYTDYEAYSDAEYTNRLSGNEGCYMFSTSKDITVYLKTPTDK